MSFDDDGARTLDEVLRDDRLKPAWLMYIACSPAVRCWSGVANFKLGPNSGQDVAGGLYQGLGLMVGVPSLQIPLNGEFISHTFSLSGVSAEAMRLVNADKETVRNARIAFARIELDASGNPVAAPVWIWVGWVDTPRLTKDGSTNPPTRTVGLVCSTGSPRRNVRAFGYWTGVQQRAIDPNDSSCDYVSYYASGTDEIWPN